MGTWQIPTWMTNPVNIPLENWIWSFRFSWLWFGLPAAFSCCMKLYVTNQTLSRIEQKGPGTLFPMISVVHLEGLSLKKSTWLLWPSSSNIKPALPGKKWSQMEKTNMLALFPFVEKGLSFWIKTTDLLLLFDVSLHFKGRCQKKFFAATVSSLKTDTY